MFCVNCGREIIDTARFCNYCGRPVQNIAPPPPPYPSQNIGQQFFAPPPPQPNFTAQPEAPNTAPLSGSEPFAENSPITTPESAGSAAPEASQTDPTTECGLTASSPEVSQTDFPAPQDPTIGNFSAAAGDPFPTPNAIPQSGFGVSGTYSAPQSGFAGAPTAEKPKRERKYTLGHIMLCLAAVAIMAITAGVFAGLYFSVV